jgi:hypothetical protein
LQTLLLTAGVLLNRAMKRRDLLWLCGLLPVTLLIISPANLASCRLVSLAAFLPSIFLLTGWNDSSSRIGLLALLYRTGKENRVRITEITLPALTGTLLSAVLALLVKSVPPWQFWLVTPLTATAFSFIFIKTESSGRYPGRVALALLWIWGTVNGGNPQGISALAIFTEYPGTVLSASAGTGHHPDTFVLASLILVMLSVVLYSLSFFRSK